MARRNELKPCQFQRTVYWHCECDKRCSMLVASYWQFVVHGQGAIKQTSLVSPGFNLHLSEVSLKVESAWTTVGRRFKPGQRLIRK